MLRRFRLAVLLLLLCLPAATSLAAKETTDGQHQWDAKAVLLMELDSGRMLVSKAPELATPPASLTKIMTLYVLFDAIERGELSFLDSVRISAGADRTGGSSMGALTNHEYTMWEILKGIAVASGNDAAQAAAENFPGGFQAFIARMNETASELGLENSRFENPHGLHHPRQTVTARDMLVLAAAYLRRFPQALRLHSMPYSWQDGTRLRNRNRLLGECRGVDGLKTGYVRASGYNVVVSARRNGVRLVGVVLGASSPTRRARTARKLLETGFELAGNSNLTPPAPGYEETRISAHNGDAS